MGHCLRWVSNTSVCVASHWLLAAVLLPMEHLISETVDYTRERKAFGRSILDNQVVHYRLAELETEVELLRSLLYRAVGVCTHTPTTHALTRTHNTCSHTRTQDCTCRAMMSPSWCPWAS